MPIDRDNLIAVAWIIGAFAALYVLKHLGWV